MTCILFRMIAACYIPMFLTIAFSCHYLDFSLLLATFPIYVALISCQRRSYHILYIHVQFSRRNIICNVHGYYHIVPRSNIAHAHGMSEVPIPHGLRRSGDSLLGRAV